jgi:ribonuclease VapC
MLMFLDASAIVAILAGEDDAASLTARVARAAALHTSGLAIYEAAAGLARIGNVPPRDALELVNAFLADARAQVVPIERKTAEQAVDAFARFGKGRHKAGLNMGDCFAYACARQAMAPLLCKGDDFPQTDIELA